MCAMKIKTQQILSIILSAVLVFSQTSYAVSIKLNRVVIVSKASLFGQDDPVADEFVDLLKQELKSEFSVLNKSVLKQIKSLPENQNEPESLSAALKMLKEGREAYTLYGNSSKALTGLQKTQDLIQQKISATRASSALLVSTLIARAWIHFERGQFKQCHQVLDRLAYLNRKNVIHEIRFSQKFKSHAQKYLRGIENHRPLGSMDISSTPKAVDVMIDGIFVGVTPISLELPNGSYSVTMAASGRQSFTKTYSVKAQGTHFVSARLKWVRNDRRNLLRQDYPREPELLSKLLAISSKTQAERVILVDSNRIKGKYYPSAQVFDVQHAQLFSSYIYKRGATDLSEASQKIVNGMLGHIGKNLGRPLQQLYRNDFDQSFVVDQRVAGRGSVPITKKPLFWGVVGAVVLTGVVSGILAATSKSSSSSSSQSGMVTVGLEGF